MTNPPKVNLLETDYLDNKDNYGSKLEDDYLKYGLQISKRNKDYVMYTLHAIVGQMFRNKYFMLDELMVDMATPIIILQDTGSGKTVLKHFLEKLCIDLGLNYQDISIITAGGLVGTSTYDPNEKKQKIVYGVLQYANLLMMDEADVLFSHLTDEMYKDCAIMLQKAADSKHMGDTRIRKKLTLGEPVDYFADCTSILGSYIPRSFNDLATHTGLFPRHVTLVRHIPLEERIAVGHELINTLNSNPREKYQEDYDKIMKRLKMLQRTYGTKKERMEFTNEARERLRVEFEELVDIVKDSSLLTRHVLGGFLIRYIIMLMKLSCHHAILRFSHQVEIEDVVRASNRFKVVWQTLTAYLEMSLIQDPKEKLIFNARIHSSVHSWHLMSENKTPTVVIKISNEIYVRFLSLMEFMREQDAWGDCSLNAAKQYFLTNFVKKKNQVDSKAYFESVEVGKNKVLYIKLIRDLIL